MLAITRRIIDNVPDGGRGTREEGRGKREDEGTRTYVSTDAQRVKE
jgi:hypothetical protein